MQTIKPRRIKQIRSFRAVASRFVGEAIYIDVDEGIVVHLVPLQLNDR